MRTKMKHSLSGIFVFTLVLLTSSTCQSYYGGGYHGGGGNYHGGGGYYHGGGGGYYHGHGGYYGGPSVIIGLPFGGYYGPEYYAPPPCETIRICNSVGQCWLERECD